MLIYSTDKSKNNIYIFCYSQEIALNVAISVNFSNV